LTSSFLNRWDSEKNKLKQGRVPGVSFQEVEGDKHNFVSLSGFLLKGMVVSILIKWIAI
jgi:hypothetical protein